MKPSVSLNLIPMGSAIEISPRPTGWETQPLTERIAKAVEIPYGNRPNVGATLVVAQYKHTASSESISA